nr:hypothetical protein Q903MT_gene6418 [Picea sitchensis]
MRGRKGKVLTYSLGPGSFTSLCSFMLFHWLAKLNKAAKSSSSYLCSCGEPFSVRPP